MQMVREQFGEKFIADIFLKIFEDNVLNKLDKYFLYVFFTDIRKYLRKYLVFKITVEQ